MVKFVVIDMYRKFKFPESREVRDYNAVSRIKLTSTQHEGLLLVRMSDVPRFLIDDLKEFVKEKQSVIIENQTYVLKHDWNVFILRKQKEALFIAYDAEEKYDKE